MSKNTNSTTTKWSEAACVYAVARSVQELPMGHGFPMSELAMAYDAGAASQSSRIAELEAEVGEQEAKRARALGRVAELEMALRAAGTALWKQGGRADSPAYRAYQETERALGSGLLGGE